MSGRAFRPSRRTVLTAAGAAGLMCATEGVAVADGKGTERARAVGRSSRVQLTLPRPDGRLPVGTMSPHLIDQSRPDPWTSPARRELMVSLWYPAQHTRDFRRAAWLPPAATALYRQQVSAGLHTSLDGADFPVTHAYENAPARAGLRGHPVVLFSPAYRTPRALGTALVEDLASRGFRGRDSRSHSRGFDGGVPRRASGAQPATGLADGAGHQHRAGRTPTRRQVRTA
ncbi:hypothetical protein PWY87_25630 [Kribbella solani]|uniref:alpha/beta hydrolase n=1 Tax=Kribbella solani TaxID=236067 RepID=UPI0029B0A98A|nr:hypothetical protein [Kribbella solani]MDX2968398.1 hypothetical protein [Kribbella solani]MDX3005082.1 hypothetical protein [Kribbella solani]